MKIFVVISVVGSVLGACADDWPQYAGLNRDNVSAETGLADTWPETGPNVLWETTLNNGYSGAAVKDGKAYVCDRNEQQGVLRCLDMETGKDLWTVSFADPGTMKSDKYAGTRGTPTVTDDEVYLVTGYGALVCVDLKTKKVKWQRHLVEDFDHELATFGIAQSPFIYGNMVLVAPNTDLVGVVAYEKKSGEKLWASESVGFHAYISPLVETICGEDMVITVGSSEKGRRGSKKKDAEELKAGHVVGLSPKDGSVLWDYAEWRCVGSIPHPLKLSDDRLFVTGGYKAGSVVLEISKSDSGYAVSAITKTDSPGAKIHQPIRLGDQLFMVVDGGGLASVDLEGEVLWRTKDVEDAPLFKLSPFIMADGKLVALDAKSGVLHLIKADPAQYTPLSSSALLTPREMSWAPMALSDGRLLIRDWNTMKCIDLK